MSYTHESQAEQPAVCSPIVEVCDSQLVSKVCRPDYGFFVSDSRDFSPGWKHVLNRTDYLSSRLELAFVFLSFFKLQVRFFLASY